jgi:hypothetical protein
MGAAAVKPPSRPHWTSRRAKAKANAKTKAMHGVHQAAHGSNKKKEGV